jgi:hypothetical protein
MNTNMQLELIQNQQDNLSANKVYRGWLNAGGTGSFKDFMTKAQQEGWLDQGLNALSALAYTKYGTEGTKGDIIGDTPCDEGYAKDENGICQPIKKGMSTIAMVGIGVAIAGVITGVIILMNKKK